MFREVGGDVPGLQHHKSQEGNKELEEREVNHQCKYCREFEEGDEIKPLIGKRETECNCSGVDWCLGRT